MKLTLLSIALHLIIAPLCGIMVVCGYDLLKDNIKAQDFKENVVNYSIEGLTKEPINI